MRLPTWRARFDRLLAPAESPPWPTQLVSGILVGLVLVSVIATVLETLQETAQRIGWLLRLIEALVVAVMVVEYALRLWAAPEREAVGARQPWLARLHYATSFVGLVDLLAVLPALVAVVVPVPTDALRLLRVLRLLKLARYTPALTLFAAVIRNERRALLATVLVVAVLLVLESSIMYVLEREAQPKVFASIPHAMWWAIVTIATVGYGDMFPITPAGKVFGGAVMVIGIAVFAVPAGILATGFASEIRKRDFVVTWQTVANVPLFAGLDAARIAEIARLLKRQVVPAQFAVVRRGDPADAMFFIMGGEVQVDVAPTPVRLTRGQYFGEIALLRDTVRTATVTTLTECQLLSLDVADFRRLLDANPSLNATITRTAEARLGELMAGAATLGHAGAEGGHGPAAAPGA
jgi:voltage-gated potassium channel